MIQFIFNKITELNALLETLLNNNEFAIGLVITFILGSTSYLLRSIPTTVYQFVKRHTITSLEIRSNMDSYYDLLKYLQVKGINTSSRKIKMLNGRYGDSKLSKALGYGSQFFILNKQPILILISQVDGVTGDPIDQLTISKFGRSHKYFDNIILNIKDNYKDAGVTRYYEYKNNYNSMILTQPRRKLSSIFIDKETKDLLTSTIDTFIKNEQFCIDHGIPYQLGILLYGPPGTGKTSLLKAIADYTNRDITTVSNIEELTSACGSEQDNKIIVAEEIDTYGIAKRDNVEDTDEIYRKEFKKIKKQKINNAMNIHAFTEFLLGKLLTSIDGLISNHGRILIITTNKRISLDPALTRPGRIDLQLNIGYMSTESLFNMLDVFFNDFIKPTEYQIIKNISPNIIQNDILNNVTYTEILEKYKGN